MNKKIFLAAALAAATLLAACGEQEEPAGNNTTAAPTVTAAPTNAPAQPTAEPAASNPTAEPASNTAAPASNTATPKPADTPLPAQTNGGFDAIAGSWHSPANNTHGELSLKISSDGTSSLGTLVNDGDGRYHVDGTTMTLSLEKWADGSERLYVYDSYTYEDATYSRSN